MATFLGNVGNYFGLGNAPNVLTGGATDQPDWTPSLLDNGTNTVIGQQAALGNQSQQDIVSKDLYGTSATMPTATGGAVAEQQAELGGGNASDNAAVSQALNDRANRLYASQYNQLLNAAIAGAPAQQGQYMSQAANALQQQQNVNDQLNRQQIAVTLQKQSLRNQIIGQLMGGAGTAAGLYASGRRTGSYDAPTQKAFDELNSPDNKNNPGNFTSDPNAPYNLTGDLSSQTPDYLGLQQMPANQAFVGSMGLGASQPNLGVSTEMGHPGEDGNGYYSTDPQQAYFLTGDPNYLTQYGITAPNFSTSLPGPSGQGLGRTFQGGQ